MTKKLAANAKANALNLLARKYASLMREEKREREIIKTLMQDAQRR